MRLLDRLISRQGYWEGMASGAAILTSTYGAPDREAIVPQLTAATNAAYGGNAIVFGAILARAMLFSEATFKFRARSDGKLTDLPPRADLLEKPWPNGTTGELLVRMEQDASLAGNAYVWNTGDGMLARLRPDWVTIVTEEVADATGMRTYRRPVGYWYEPPTVAQPGWGEPQMYDVGEVAHWSPIPQPDAQFRGMSWLTPVVHEINADDAMTAYKIQYLNNAATPNILIRYDKQLLPETVDRIRERVQARYGGVQNAFKTLVLDQGADATILGHSFEQMNFSTVQAAGENRILVASGVPGIVVGTKEGLSAATYCLISSSVIWTPRGPVLMGDLREGDTVWSHLDGGLAPRKILRHWKTGRRRIYKIQTRNRVLRASGNHPVLTRRPGSKSGPQEERSAGLEWRRADSLLPGDKIVQVKSLPDLGGTRLPDGRPATPEMMQFLGGFLGDGCINQDRGVRMCIPRQDRVRSHYEQLTVSLFTQHADGHHRRPGKRAKDGLTAEMVRLSSEELLTPRQIVARMNLDIHPMSVRDRIRTATAPWVEGERRPVSIGETRNGFQFWSTEAVEQLRTYGFARDAKSKRVPGWVFELTRDLRLAFLAGVVDTDGSIAKNGSLIIHFANQRLVEDVQMLLVSCGIQCSNIARYEYRADVLPNRGSSATYEAWRFTASSAVQVAQIPFADPLYRERVEANPGRVRVAGGRDAGIAGLDTDTLGFFTVVSVDVEDIDDVYDIEVEDGHSFVADGIVVHNSNYAQAMRRFADITMRPLWRSVCSCLSALVPVPAGQRLWYDTSDIAALRQGEKERADTVFVQAQAVAQFVAAGYEPASAAAAAESGDLSQLEFKEKAAPAPAPVPPPPGMAGGGQPGGPAPSQNGNAPIPAGT